MPTLGGVNLVNVGSHAEVGGGFSLAGFRRIAPIGGRDKVALSGARSQTRVRLWDKKIWHIKLHLQVDEVAIIGGLKSNNTMTLYDDIYESPGVSYTVKWTVGGIQYQEPLKLANFFLFPADIQLEEV